jgi:site-specific DNA recombinase
MKSAAIYARVSTDKQSASSVRDQVREARRFAQENGFSIVQEYCDDGISGTDDDRPAFVQMMRDAEARKFKVIITESADRISRNEWMLPRLVAELRFRDQALLTYDGKYDSRNSSSGLLAAVEGFVSSAEREKLVHRTRRGLAGCHEAKLNAGGRAYGYKSVRLESTDPRFDHQNDRRRQAYKAINEAEAKWVRRIFERRGKDGWSCERIARELIEESVPPPGAHWRGGVRYNKEWTDSAVRVILRNPLYKGLYVWNRTERRRVPGKGRNSRKTIERPRSEWRVLEMPELRIVEPALWERVNSLFKASPVLAAAAARRGRGPRYPLSGILRCSCGANYVYCGRESYRCGRFHANHKVHKDCSNGIRFGRKEIEAAVMDAFEGSLLTPEAIRYVTTAAQRLIEQRQRAVQQQRKRAPAEVSKLDAEIEELRSMLKAGKVRPELLQPALEAAQARRSALLRKADTADANLADRVAVVIPRAAERVRQIVMRLRGTTNAEHARDVRETLRRFIPDGAIALRLDAKSRGFSGTLKLDASRYLLEIPAVNKVAPPAGVEPTTYRLGGGRSIH